MALAPHAAPHLTPNQTHTPYTINGDGDECAYKQNCEPYTLVGGEAVLRIRVSSTDEPSEQSVTYLL